MSVRLALTFALALFLCPYATAQPASVKSGAVVLVLKLVSATHVKPGTGLVVSTDGWVVVPAGFATAGDEIVVLDGGTDISRYGRPATVIKASASGLLMLLAVEGLDRPAIKLTKDVLSKGSSLDVDLHLSAFPPAEKIATGEQPLWIPIKLVRQNSAAKFSVSPATPLPNVSGAIVNRCGQLLGLNLAVGTPALATDKNPRTVLRAELTQALAALGVSLATASCGPPAKTQPSQPEEVISPPAPPATHSTTDAGNSTHSNPVIEAEATDASNDNSAGLAASDTSDSREQRTVENTPTGVSATRPTANWIWILGPLALVLAGLIAVKRFFRRNKHSPQPGVTELEPNASMVFAEPDTAALQAGTDEAPMAAADGNGDANKLPDIDTLPVGYDALLVVEGLINKSQFRRFCMVNSKKINIIIGRADADISIASSLISRMHVRLEGSEKSLTLTDLGSRNGSFIRGIPCLSGEIMFIEPGDEIQLGRLRLQFKLITKSAALP